MPDGWLLNGLNTTVATMDASLPQYKFSEATTVFYDFFLKTFCDVYIEAVKPVFPYDQTQGNPDEKHMVLNVMHCVLETCYRALHPISPFISEELWQRLPGEKESEACIVASYPGHRDTWVCQEYDANMANALELLDAIRSTREGLKIAMKLRPKVMVVQSTKIPDYCLQMIATLASVGEVRQVSKAADSNSFAQKILSKDCTVYIETAGMIDVSAEIKKVKKGIAQAEKKVGALEKKLNNQNFMSKAKPEIIDKFRTQYESLKVELQKMNDSLSKYQAMG